MAAGVCGPEIGSWQDPDSKLGPSIEESHVRRWNQHVGKGVGILLHNAGYHPDFQARSMEFFSQLVAPNLGKFTSPMGDQPNSWKSFMTDDGCPVELSWDWVTNDKRPTIRYSIEPVGMHAGTSTDPYNLLAAPALQNQLARALPDMRVEWFTYFRDYFDDRGSREAEHNGVTGDHKTSIFYAFDLSETETTAKVYFFPHYRARSYGQSNLEVLWQAIKSAPLCTEDNLGALSVLYDYATDQASQALELEMLAIDLIDPLKSRQKIYFRSRDTSFNSVMDIMTLGGRLKSQALQKGLAQLQILWSCLFGADLKPDQSLETNDHRTAGMLYNVEFRLGDQFPVAKIYLPVRHYSENDASVIAGLDQYFQSCQRGSYMPAYLYTMTRLFGYRALVEQSGIQTYVGCAVRPDGQLRVVSYFKPAMSEPI